MIIKIDGKEELNDWMKRYLQAFPHFIGLVLTFYMFFSAHQSLKVWRALQVYDSQKITRKRGFTGENEKTRIERVKQFFIHFFNLGIIIILIPIDKYVSIPFYSNIRQMIPYIFIGALSFAGSIKFCNQFMLNNITVERMMEKNRKSKEKKAGEVELKRKTISTGNEIPIKVQLMCLLTSFILSYYCAMFADPISIVKITAIISAYICINQFITPIPAKTVSLRAHVKGILICLGLYFVTLLVIFILIFYFEKGQFNENEKGNGDQIDLEILQFNTINYTYVWSIAAIFPANLVALAYRYDLHKKNLTVITEEEKEFAILESRNFAKQSMIHSTSSSSIKHPFDNLGRTPILLNSNALSIKLSSKDLFESAFVTIITIRALILLQLIGLLITWKFLPPSFNILYFIKTQEQANKYPYFYSFNWSCIFAYFCLPFVMLFSAGLQARKEGKSFKEGVQDLWKYEENWKADYDQAPIDDSDTDKDMEEGIEFDEDENIVESMLLLSGKSMDEKA